MKTSMKISLFLGAVTVVAATGLAAAQLEGPMPPDGPMQGLMRGHSRLADRLLESFDKNHDGKVTHDEMNRAIYAQFVAVTHGAPTMTQDQFIAMHMAEFRQHAGEMFKRIDWRGQRQAFAGRLRGAATRALHDDGQRRERFRVLRLVRQRQTRAGLCR